MEKQIKVILVGNGTSVLDSKRGHTIDSFDIVVRFNDFRIEGFEEYVGERTNIWFTCGDAHLEEANKFNRVILHTWEYENNFFVKEFGKKRKFEMTKKNEVSKIPVLYPSTGLIAIHQFIKEFGYVTIVGFDWWEREEHHYGDNIHKRGEVHKPLQEYEVIKKLQLDGKLGFLS